MKTRFQVCALAALFLLAALILPATSSAHCDGLDGPVVNAARAALEQHDVNLTLVWVKPGDEPAIREAYTHALAVRKLGPEARELADRWFFETLVRIHRAGEGAPYTGLKPAGRDLGPAIPAADRALETGELEPLAKLLLDAVHETLHRRFESAKAARGYAKDDLAAGREYVARYVTFLHQVEAMHAAATRAPGEHIEEAAAEPAHGHEEK